MGQEEATTRRCKRRKAETSRTPSGRANCGISVAAALMLLLLLLLLGISLPPRRGNTVVLAAHAFSPIKPLSSARPRSSSSSGGGVALGMGRKKGSQSGGRLGDMVDSCLDSTTSVSTSTPTGDGPTSANGSRLRSGGSGSGSGTRKPKAALSSSSASTKKTTKAKKTEVGISPLLAQWAAGKIGDGKSNPDDDDGNVNGKAPPRPTREASADTRRQRQSQRKELERERGEIARKAVESIVAMLSDDDDADGDSSNNDNDRQKRIKEPFKVETLLARIRELLELSTSAYDSTALRRLAAGSSATDYRLAWVGSDEAMCHLGTGLHKVKLARLQEVFLTVGPKSKVLMYEVIRILGPFPNVKNTLVGKSAVDKPRDNRMGGGQVITAQPWKITWQSLIDGTGKEILAGSQVRNVDLEVLWCDASLLVCAAALGWPAGERNADLLHDDGRDLFVFVKEGGMESKLDALRVI